MTDCCHAEHTVGFTGAPLGRDTGEFGKWLPCAEIEQAKAACKAARWPEHHRDDCAWCALVASERAFYESLTDA